MNKSMSTSLVKENSDINRSRSLSPVEEGKDMERSRSPSPAKEGSILDKSRSSSPVEEPDVIDRSQSPSSVEDTKEKERSRSPSSEGEASDMEESRSPSPVKDVREVERSRSPSPVKDVREVERSRSPSPAQEINKMARASSLPVKGDRKMARASSLPVKGYRKVERTSSLPVKGYRHMKGFSSPLAGDYANDLERLKSQSTVKKVVTIDGSGSPSPVQEINEMESSRSSSPVQVINEMESSRSPSPSQVIKKVVKLIIPSSVTETYKMERTVSLPVKGDRKIKRTSSLPGKGDMKMKRTCSLPVKGYRQMKGSGSSLAGNYANDIEGLKSQSSVRKVVTIDRSGTPSPVQEINEMECSRSPSPVQEVNEMESSRSPSPVQEISELKKLITSSSVTETYKMARTSSLPVKGYRKMERTSSLPVKGEIKMKRTCSLPVKGYRQMKGSGSSLADNYSNDIERLKRLSAVSKVVTIDRSGSSSPVREINEMKSSRSPSPVQEVNEMESSRSPSPVQEVNEMESSRSPSPVQEVNEMESSRSPSPVQEVNEMESSRSPSPVQEVNEMESSRSLSPVQEINEMESSRSPSPLQEVSELERLRSPSSVTETSRMERTISLPIKGDRKIMRTSSLPVKGYRQMKGSSSSLAGDYANDIERLKSQSTVKNVVTIDRSGIPSPMQEISEMESSRSPSPIQEISKIEKIKSPSPVQEINEMERSSSPSIGKKAKEFKISRTPFAFRIKLRNKNRTSPEPEINEMDLPRRQRKNDGAEQAQSTKSKRKPTVKKVSSAQPKPATRSSKIPAFDTYIRPFIKREMSSASMCSQKEGKKRSRSLSPERNFTLRKLNESVHSTYAKDDVSLLVKRVLRSSDEEVKTHFMTSIADLSALMTSARNAEKAKASLSAQKAKEVQKTKSKSQPSIKKAILEQHKPFTRSSKIPVFDTYIKPFIRREMSLGPMSIQREGSKRSRSLSPERNVTVRKLNESVHSTYAKDDVSLLVKRVLRSSDEEVKAHFMTSIADLSALMNPTRKIRKSKASSSAQKAKKAQNAKSKSQPTIKKALRVPNKPVTRSSKIPVFDAYIRPFIKQKVSSAGRSGQKKGNKRSRSLSPERNVKVRKLNESVYDTYSKDDASLLVKRVLRSSDEEVKMHFMASIADLSANVETHRRCTVSQVQKESVTSNALKRKSRSPSAESSTPKISRRERRSPIRATVTTRRSAAMATRQSPNHSLSNISHKKVQMFKAVEEGDLDLVKELMQDTGPAVRNGKKSNTLLHAAAASNRCEVAFYLLKLISPNIVNRDEQTPVHLAAAEGHAQVLKILLADGEILPDKRDTLQRTYKDMLSAPLFEAVMNDDKKKIELLLKLGADPDYHAGKIVDGIMTRELRVTTTRQLAFTLHGEKYHSLFSKKRNFTNDKTKPAVTMTSSPKHFPVHDTSSSKRSTRSGASQMLEQGTFKNTEPNHRGYICMLNFESFSGRPELEREASSVEVQNLSKVFEKMGYCGDVYTSLTLDDARNTLVNFRDMDILNDSGCAIIVISSHSANKESFLTSDMKLLSTEWVMNLFKDSECPQLKNKPKLFIFDFKSGYYMGNINLRHPQPKSIRVEEPLQDAMCLLSESNGLTFCSNQRHSFMTALSQILSKSSDKEFTDLHQELLREYAKGNYGPLPELRNLSLAQGFYLNPKLATTTSPCRTTRATV